MSTSQLMKLLRRKTLRSDEVQQRAPAEGGGGEFSRHTHWQESEG